ncbi:hypothetical protein SN4111_02360 [Ligilactobacillus agilis]|nr:hypothetical protein SN4111_02360 [Ligilactobacillus agilis]
MWKIIQKSIDDKILAWYTIKVVAVKYGGDKIKNLLTLINKFDIM